jgi:hypothetical protein
MVPSNLPSFLSITNHKWSPSPSPPSPSPSLPFPFAKAENEHCEQKVELQNNHCHCQPEKGLRNQRGSSREISTQVKEWSKMEYGIFHFMIRSASENGNNMGVRVFSSAIKNIIVSPKKWSEKSVIGRMKSVQTKLAFCKSRRTPHKRSNSQNIYDTEKGMNRLIYHFLCMPCIFFLFVKCNWNFCTKFLLFIIAISKIHIVEKLA